jgi:hypothetical protein
MATPVAVTKRKRTAKRSATTTFIMTDVLKYLTQHLPDSLLFHTVAPTNAPAVTLPGAGDDRSAPMDTTSESSLDSKRQSKQPPSSSTTISSSSSSLLPAAAVAGSAGGVRGDLLRQMEDLLVRAHEHKIPFDATTPIVSLRTYLQDFKDETGTAIVLLLSICRALFPGVAEGSAQSPPLPLAASMNEFTAVVQTLAGTLDNASAWSAKASAFESMRKACNRLGRQLNDGIRASTAAGDEERECDLVRCASPHEAAGLLPYDGRGRVLVGRFSEGRMVLGGKAQGTEVAWATARREFEEETKGVFDDHAVDWKALDVGVKTSQFYPSGSYMLYLVPIHAMTSRTMALDAVCERYAKAPSQGGRGKMPLELEWIDLNGVGSRDKNWSSWGKQVVFGDAGVRAALGIA